MVDDRHILGELKSDVGTLKRDVSKFEKALVVLDQDVKALGWRSVYGAAAICVSGLLLALLVYNMLSDQVSTLDENVAVIDAKLDSIGTRVAVIENSLETIKTSIAGVETTSNQITIEIQQLSDRQEKMEASTAEALSRIESVLGELTLKVDGSSSLEEPGLGGASFAAGKSDIEPVRIVVNSSDGEITKASNPSEDDPSSLHVIAKSDDASLTSCTNAVSNETRVVAVIYDSTKAAVPCKLLYEKDGMMTEVASAQNTSGHCEKRERQIVSNLFQAGWQCTHSFTGELVQEANSPIVKFRQALYAQEGGDLSAALSDPEGLVTTQEEKIRGLGAAAGAVKSKTSIRKKSFGLVEEK